MSEFKTTYSTEFWIDSLGVTVWHEYDSHTSGQHRLRVAIDPTLPCVEGVPTPLHEVATFSLPDDYVLIATGRPRPTSSSRSSRPARPPMVASSKGVDVVAINGQATGRRPSFEGQLNPTAKVYMCHLIRYVYEEISSDLPADAPRLTTEQFIDTILDGTSRLNNAVIPMATSPEDATNLRDSLGSFSALTPMQQIEFVRQTVTEIRK